MGRWKHSMGLARSRCSAVSPFFISRSPPLVFPAWKAQQVLQEGTQGTQGQGVPPSHGDLGPGPPLSLVAMCPCVLLSLCAPPEDGLKTVSVSHRVSVRGYGADGVNVTGLGPPGRPPWAPRHQAVGG